MEKNTEELVQNILKEGFIKLDLYDEKELNQLTKMIKKYSLKPYEIMRNFNHPAYKAAVTPKVKQILFKIAHQKVKFLPEITSSPSLITEENISISFSKKGPTFGNAKINKHTFHYDNSFLNLVLPLELPPEPSKGSGLYAYINLKKKFGMGFISKVISLLLGRISILRIFFRPRFLKYKRGIASIFFGDISLHGVGDCSDGDRRALTINLSQTPYNEFKAKYCNSHKYLNNQ